jgi:hypothetical protein
MLKRPLALVSTLVLIVVLGSLAGCIVSDQVSTLTIRQDGSADWIRVQSNIRSTKPGADGAQELKQFVEDFDARKDEDFQRMALAGAEVLEARWLRREEPYANVVVARFPSVASLREFSTLKDAKGEVVVRPHFSQSGKRRRFSLTVSLPPDQAAAVAAAEKPTFDEFRREQADGISETRVVVAGGSIVSSEGFTVAADKRSALLDVARARELIRKGAVPVELYLEWDVVDG